MVKNPAIGIFIGFANQVVVHCTKRKRHGKPPSLFFYQNLNLAHLSLFMTDHPTFWLEMDLWEQNPIQKNERTPQVIN